MRSLLSKIAPGLLKRAQSRKDPTWLDRSRIPFFMEPGGVYEVVEGPVHSGSAPFGLDQFYTYGIRHVYKNEPTYYFQAPFKNLPRKFQVRKVEAGTVYFEYHPYDKHSDHVWLYPPVEDDDLVPVV